ncbi:MAG: fumarylacetoacetate hydrolase family protein [Salibacteraceae bacterium]
MKIMCIGRNYADHAKELNNAIPNEPVFFLKPDTALLTRNKPFFYPDFSKEIHFETEVVVKIKRLGKNIEERFAHKYYDEVGLGIDFTARDLQRTCKQKGLPWEKAKAFDNSAAISEFVPLSSLPDSGHWDFHLDINGERKQTGNTRDMLFSIHRVIAYLSQFFTLRTGDLIYTGTPAGVGPVHIGDYL